ncbi:hypothetical protein OG589_17705 [Sphaerisporangium sp. NBC_01403]|uniref:hypothetical protein n=1 Tax=Sphaerisporangium sp. NBC_01403 TaxID=2903599 RepID=UPI0032444DC3
MGERQSTGGFISGTAQDAAAVATGCCGEPASGPAAAPAELVLLKLAEEEDSGSGCCGEPAETGSSCCG